MLNLSSLNWPVSSWAKSIGSSDSFIAGLVESWAHISGPWAEAVQTAAILRLAPAPANPREALASALKGEMREPFKDIHAAVRKLTQEQCRDLLHLGLAAVDQLHDQLEDLMGLSQSDEGFIPGLRRLAHNRDDAEGVLGLLHFVGEEDRLACALKIFDEVAAPFAFSLPVGLLEGDERLERVILHNPEAWWAIGFLALPPDSNLSVGYCSFALRQLATTFKGTKLTQQEFEDILVRCKVAIREGKELQGYAPFVKVVCLDASKYNIKASVITKDEAEKNMTENYDPDFGWLGDGFDAAGYESRTPGEPAMPKTPSYAWRGENLPKAPFVHVILYSRAQLEMEKMDHSGADWDIICINAETDDKSAIGKDGLEHFQGTPMTPTTLIRNHLGKEWGGSGQTIDIEEYRRSVDFWEDHCLVR